MEGVRELSSTALDVEHLSKHFGPTQALNDVSLTIGRGRVHGLVGGNGSGKSTLIKVLAGIHAGEPGGVLRVNGTEIAADAMTPGLAMQLGLRFVHQDPAVYPALSVAENLAIGSAGGFPTRGGRIRWKVLEKRSAQLLERFGIEARPSDPLDQLRPAVQTMVAIARALRDGGDDGSVLVLDEPTAALPEHEVDTLLSAIRRYSADGETILYVSHRLDELLAIVDDVTILRDGAVVTTRTATGLSTDDLVAGIVGRALELTTRPVRDLSGAPIRLTLDGVSGGPLREVSMAVRAGEIVGVAGLLGSGRSELLRMIFGDLNRAAGTMILDGEPYAPTRPYAAMARGVALVPEDRARDAAFPDLSVTHNLTIARLERFRRLGRLRRRAEAEDSADTVAAFGVRAPGCDAPLTALSGGNQQKVVVARWLRRSPRLLLLDEPTQGVDVGARRDLYELIARARADGLSVIVVSSDFEELAHVCDRVVALRDGRITAETAGNVDADQITRLVQTG